MSKVVVVTGGASGIGEATARRFNRALDVADAAAIAAYAADVPDRRGRRRGRQLGRGTAERHPRHRHGRYTAYAAVP